MPRSTHFTIVRESSEIPEKHQSPTFRRELYGQVYIIKGVKGMMQFCRACNVLKNEEDFSLHSEIDQYGRKKLKSNCKDCENKHSKIVTQLKKIHGPPPDKCQLCNKEKKTELDHCHETHEFRGWLCNNCNSGLGRFQDSVELLETAIKYLKGELKNETNNN